MTKAQPPERGKKYSDLLKREWRLEIPAANYRWYRTPGKMEAGHFELDGFDCLVGFQPFYYKRVENDEEKHYYAVRASFDRSHVKYDQDYKKAEILVGKNGRVFQAIEKAEIFQPEKRLYISGLPDEAEVADIKGLFKEYATFYEHTKKVFCMEQGRFGGKMMIRVKQFLKVPPKFIHLTCDQEDYNGLGIAITATGYEDGTPVEPTTRKCFKCKTTGHLAKDCKMKMKFTWKCTLCNLTSLQCYEGHCAFDQMKEVLTATARSVTVEVGKSTRSKTALASTMEAKIGQGHVMIESIRAKVKAMKDRAMAETRGLASRRYLDRARRNFQKHPNTAEAYETEFEDFVNSLWQRCSNRSTEAISMHE